MEFALLVVLGLALAARPVTARRRWAAGAPDGPSTRVAAPLRGRLLLAGGPILLVAIGALWPPLIPMLFLVLLTAAWVAAHRALFAAERDRRFKSIDMGTGVLVVPETGGPPSEILRFELEIWRRAGAESLARIPSPEEGP